MRVCDEKARGEKWNRERIRIEKSTVDPRIQLQRMKGRSLLEVCDTRGYLAYSFLPVDVGVDVDDEDEDMDAVDEE